MSNQTTNLLTPATAPQPSKIRVSLYSGSVGGAAESEEQVSPWLYLAGMLATMCAIFAMSYGTDDPSSGLMLYVLAVCGFTTSYILRIRKISLTSIQIPLFVCLALIFYIGVSSGLGISVTAPTDGTPDRTRLAQVGLTWFAVLLGFVMQSNAGVLFVCVPCLTVLALVSSSNTDAEIQTAFLLFLASATFLLVHENSLRTRKALLFGSPIEGERRQIVWQFAMAAVCFISAALLANLIAAPIHQILPNFMVNSEAENSPAKSAQSTVQNIQVQERTSMDLATGSVSSSTAELLKIMTEVPDLYWRGTTFDYYTGHKFRNTVGYTYPVMPLSETNLSALKNKLVDPNDGSIKGSIFHIPTSIYELSAQQMEKSRRVTQTVAIQGGSFNQFYGAGNIDEIKTLLSGIQFDSAGGLMTTMPMRFGSSYSVSSVVATHDPDALRAATGKIPEDIAHAYLQRASEGNPESARLRAMAREMTQGKSNNYDRAVAIKEGIASLCKYNLQAPAAPVDKDCVEFFLFESRQGYCDSFGAAMTMLCRYADIPARLASGFLTGEKQADGSYLIREKDKHVWAEVFFPHIGWIPFDATEGSVDISDHATEGGKRKNNILAWFSSHGAFPPLAALVVLALLVYVGKVEIWDRMQKRESRKSDMPALSAANRAIIASYLIACKALEKKGLARPNHATPTEFLLHLSKHPNTPPEVLRPLQILTETHGRIRYGGELATSQDVRNAEEAVTALKSALSTVRTREWALAVSQTTL